MTILSDVKAAIGVVASEDAFDAGLLVDINAAVSTLVQIGVIEYTELEVDELTEWPTFGSTDVMNLSKACLTMKVLKVFDPTASATINEIRADQIRELEARLLYEIEGE